MLCGSWLVFIWVGLAAKVTAEELIFVAEQEMEEFALEEQASLGGRAATTTVDGTTVDVRRNEIARMRSTGMSFMPEGLEKQIDTKQMADLLAYLDSIR